MAQRLTRRGLEVGLLIDNPKPTKEPIVIEKVAEEVAPVAKKPKRKTQAK